MITTFTTEQQRELVAGILRLKPETYLYSTAGNVEFVRSAYKGVYDGSAQSFRAIFKTALDAIRLGRIRPNPRSVEAFQEAFSGDAAQKSGLGCNEDAIITQLVARNLECTTENVRALIGELWDSLADNPEHTQRQEQSNVRARRIAEMTGNGTHGFTILRDSNKFDYQANGQRLDVNKGMASQSSMALKGRWSPSESPSFEEMDDATVAALYAEWKYAQDLKSMSRADLRKLVKSNGATDIFHKNVHAPDSVPDAQDKLYHPVTGEAFGQRSLIKYINEAPYNGRNLISRNGRVVARLRQLFELTIRGELG